MTKSGVNLRIISCKFVFRASNRKATHIGKLGQNNYSGGIFLALYLVIESEMGQKSAKDDLFPHMICLNTVYITPLFATEPSRS